MVVPDPSGVNSRPFMNTGKLRFDAGSDRNTVDGICGIKQVVVPEVPVAPRIR